MATRTLQRSEHAEQVHIMEWANIVSRSAPELELLYAVPNGGQRNQLVAKKLKREGAKAGVPDLHLPVARGKRHSLYIELKVARLRPTRGGKGGVSDKQAWWHKRLREQGHLVAVCYGSDEAIQTISNYLKS